MAFHFLALSPGRLEKNSIRTCKATTWAEAHTHANDLRGPKGPLFHIGARIFEFFRSLLI